MPLEHEARYKSMLFKYETTTRTDFNLKKIENPIKTVFKEQPSHLRASHKALPDDNISFVNKQGPTLPFDLLWIYPKEILRTNPRDVQQPHEKLEDSGRDQARRTRPRIIISPMVSLDDIADDESRNIVLNDMYKTTTQIAMEVVANTHENNVRAPFPGTYSPARPLILGKCKPSLVSPEMRMDSMAWDGQQLRTYLQPKRAFWAWKSTKTDEGKPKETATTK